MLQGCLMVDINMLRLSQLISFFGLIGYEEQIYVIVKNQ